MFHLVVTLVVIHWVMSISKMIHLVAAFAFEMIVYGVSFFLMEKIILFNFFF